MRRTTYAIVFAAASLFSAAHAEAKDVGRLQADTDGAALERGRQSVSAAAGDHILLADLVKTDDLGKAALTFTDKTNVRLSSNTRLVVSEYSWKLESPRDRNITLTLLSGGVVVDSRGSYAPSQGNISVQTPMASVDVTDAQVILLLDVASKRLYVTNSGGQVTVRDDKGQASLDVGNTAVIGPSGKVEGLLRSPPDVIQSVLNQTGVLTIGGPVVRLQSTDPGLSEDQAFRDQPRPPEPPVTGNPQPTPTSRPSPAPPVSTPTPRPTVRPTQPPTGPPTPTPSPTAPPPSPPPTEPPNSPL